MFKLIKQIDNYKNIWSEFTIWMLKKNLRGLNDTKVIDSINHVIELIENHGDNIPKDAAESAGHAAESAGHAARSAAKSAGYAAEYAAESAGHAAESAGYAAEYAAESAESAWSAARSNMYTKFIEILEKKK